MKNRIGMRGKWEAEEKQVTNQKKKAQDHLKKIQTRYMSSGSRDNERKERKGNKLIFLTKCTTGII